MRRSTVRHRRFLRACAAQPANDRRLRHRIHCACDDRRVCEIASRSFFDLRNELASPPRGTGRCGMTLDGRFASASLQCAQSSELPLRNRRGRGWRTITIMTDDSPAFSTVPNCPRCSCAWRALETVLAEGEGYIDLAALDRDDRSLRNQDRSASRRAHRRQSLEPTRRFSSSRRADRGCDQGGAIARPDQPRRRSSDRGGEYPPGSFTT